jgi:predicted ATPase/DNA-binding SARP family transcriptional activator
MSQLRLHLFGPPRLELDGAPVALERRKALALLVYLAVEAEPRGGLGHSREALAALLWPDYEAARALAYLRRGLWEINNALGEGWLRTERDTIGLASAQSEAGRRVWVDVAEFRRLSAPSRDHAPAAAGDSAIARLNDAAQYYGDHFLAGFSLRDAPAFDEWAFFQAETLRRDFSSLLDRLSTAYLVAGQFDAAQEAARRWLRHDGLNEDAHRRLMRIYALSGQTGAALAHFQDTQRLIRAELDADVQPETAALYHEIRHGQAAQPAAPAAAPAPVEAAVPRALPALPVEATPFVGRDKELAEIAALLEQPDCRLLTLTGPGGAGKTRLAIQAAYRARQAALANGGGFADGVVFVPLAPVREPVHIVPAIAEAVGFKFFGRPEAEDPEWPRHQLLDYLREKRMLLVLDNFEHLLPGTALLTDLLEADRQVKLLVTSRERFNLREEWVLAVPGMSFPRGNGATPDGPAPADVEAYSALQLFVQTARKVSADFRLQEEDRPHAVRICQLVEGLPLGLELAAAWTKTLTLREIALEIERSLDFLTSPLRNVAKRHHSLRAVFDYSWALLTPHEQAIFQRLSVFQGGFDREAAAAVAGAGLPALAALVDKSLLYRLPTGRYLLHQALRQFAAEQLAQAPDEPQATQSRHSAYFGRFVRDRMTALKGWGQKAALDQMSREIENLRAGFAFAAAHGAPAQVDDYLDGMYFFFEIRSRMMEGEELLRQVMAVTAPRAASSDEWAGLLARMRGWRGWFCWRTARPGDAFEEGRLALAELRRLNDRAALAQVHLVAPLVSLEEAEAVFAASMAYFQETNDQWGIAQVMLRLGWLARERGNYPEARRIFNESLALRRAIGDSWSEASLLIDLGELVHHVGEYAEARGHYEASLKIARELGDRYNESLCLDYSGYVARRMGDFAEARRRHLASLDISRQLGDQLGVAGSLDNLGVLSLDEGNVAEAARLFSEGLALRRSSGLQGGLGYSLEHMAQIAGLQGKWHEAEAHLHELADILHATNTPLWPRARIVQGDLYRGQGKLNEAEQAYRVALQEGQRQNNLPVVLESLLGLASVSLAWGEHVQAVRLLAHVAQHRCTEFAAQQRARRLLESAAASMPPEAYRQAVMWGEDTPLESVVAPYQVLQSAPAIWPPPGSSSPGPAGRTGSGVMPGNSRRPRA